MGVTATLTVPSLSVSHSQTMSTQEQDVLEHKPLVGNPQVEHSLTTPKPTRVQNKLAVDVRVPYNSVPKKTQRNTKNSKADLTVSYSYQEVADESDRLLRIYETLLSDLFEEVRI